MRSCLTMMLALSLALTLAGGAAQAQQIDEAAGDEFEDPFTAFNDFDEAFGDFDEGPVWSGFVEGAFGRKLNKDSLFDSRQSLGDLRARLETEWVRSELTIGVKVDALYDDVASDFDVETRELSLQFSPGASIDMKIGRQVLTWGTGDLLFLNDLFPKSWVSFFAGREDDYLKAPSDAVRTTWYTDAVNVDIVWSPRFEPDEYLTGRRFSFFSPLAGSVVAPRPPLAAAEPDAGIEGGELALRLFRTRGSSEFAFYLYRGFFKQPLGTDVAFAPVFPRLNVAGASMRRPLADGLVNVEFAWHDSRDDAGGSNPMVPNDQLRILLGYEFEARARLNVAFQLYLEHLQDHAALLDSSFAPEFEPVRSRELVTNRLTWRSRRDSLTLSLFTFLSPSDDDYYLRPQVNYRHSDRWTLSGGFNLFDGDRRHTFFGQLEDNSNGYLRVRFNY